MEYIDLHMHSIFSDGTDIPEVLVKKAAEAGLKMIALTDHNTFGGIREFRAAIRKYNSEITVGSTGLSAAHSPGSISPVSGTGTCERSVIAGIAGVEISTGWIEDLERTPARRNPPEIHLLGYFPLESDLEHDPAFAPLRAVLEEFRLNKIRQNESMILAMDTAGIRGRDGRLSLEGFYASARASSDSGNYNRVHIANYLAETGAVSSPGEAFDRFIDKDRPYYVPSQRIPVGRAVRAIHAGRGTAVIAHVGEYKFSESRLHTFFDDCIGWGIDGFELLHPHNTPDTAAHILRFADRFRRETGRVLLLTAGSDYHGENKKNRQGFPWDLAYAW